MNTRAIEYALEHVHPSVRRTLTPQSILMKVTFLNWSYRELRFTGTSSSSAYSAILCATEVNTYCFITQKSKLFRLLCFIYLWSVLYAVLIGSRHIIESEHNYKNGFLIRGSKLTYRVCQLLIKVCLH